MKSMENPSALGFLILLGLGLPTLTLFLNHRRNTAWRTFAESRGLVVRPPGLFKSPFITGTHQGFEVRIDLEIIGTGKNRQVYTRCAVKLPDALPAGLIVSKENFFSGIGRFFGMQDIQLGDPEFDCKVVIKGQDPLAIQDFFSRSIRREAAEKIVSIGARSRIEQNQVLLVKGGVTINPDQLDSLLESAVSNARLLK